MRVAFAGTAILASNPRSKMIYNPPPSPQSTPLNPGIRLGRRHKQTPAQAASTLLPNFFAQKMRGQVDRTPLSLWGGGRSLYINFELVLEAKIGVPAEAVELYVKNELGGDCW